MDKRGFGAELMAHIMPITLHKQSPGQKPLVSIVCTTYNHENYIRDAIEGFLMQETSFPVEVIIHDDASTDKTAEIIREFEARHPGLIRSICQTENQFSRFDGSIYRSIRHKIRGKYIARCEGDDYWIDPLKLQRQIEFLERHKDFSLCTHDFIIKFEHKGVQPIKCSELMDYLTQKAIPGENAYKLTLADFCKHLMGIHTATIVYRSNLYAGRPQWTYQTYSGDLIRNIELLKLGHGAYIPKVMSVLRKNPGGITQQIRSQKDKFAISASKYAVLSRIAPNRYKHHLLRKFIRVYGGMFLGSKTFRLPLRFRIRQIPSFLNQSGNILLSYFRKQAF